MAYQLRWYQDEAVNSVYSYFETNVGNPVIALPTGTGKSLVIAELLKQIFAQWPYQRVAMLTHVKELIEQNCEEFLAIWPVAPVGIFSAGLGRKDTVLPIIFGGIQSVAKAVASLGRIDLIIIDECHLVSPRAYALYQLTINALKAINPALKVIGLTATPYRMGQGMLTEQTFDREGKPQQSIFTDICYDLTGIEPFNRLIAEGYLSPLIPKKTNVEIDISDVSLSNFGEFNGVQLERAVDRVTYEALCEAVEMGQHRRSWLTFASGVENANKIADLLNNVFHISAAAVTSKTSATDARNLIAAHKSGELRCLVGANKFTTGYNNRMIDFIIMLRPSNSSPLWVQMLGRGTRPSPETEKENCLVGDFAGNSRRLGPINDPVIPTPPNGTRKTPSIASVKICDQCGTYNHTRAVKCICCGFEFGQQIKIYGTADDAELIRGTTPIIETFDVQVVLYNRYVTKSGLPSIRVTYICGLQSFKEHVLLDHPGFSSKKARDWFRQRLTFDDWITQEQREMWVPETTDQGLQILDKLRKPRRIRVWVNAKYPEVMSYEF